ncbi:MAG: hypothetical protein WAU86_21765 [Oricola sp.]
MKYAALASLAVAVAAAAPAPAQELPPKQVYEAMLEANRASGWIAFRDFDGRQLIYFTTLQTMHCRLSEIRYSLNSAAVDLRFELVPCNPQMAFAMPPDVKPEQVYIELPVGTARTVSVQVVWDDGTESDIMTYRPCDDVGDQTCAAVAE